MKRVIVVLLGVFFLFGCGAAARESGFYEHSTMYRNCSHLKFSTAGYKEVDQKEAQMSKAQDWWGISVWGSK
jgi:hypothetical protein